MLQAVIFDLDGLMVDTEPLHYKAYANVLGDLGVSYSVEDNAQYLGMQDSDQSKDMIQRYGLSVAVEELVRRKAEVYKGLLGEIKPRPGLSEVLHYLQGEGYRKAIASGSALVEIQTIAKALKVEPFFDGYFSSEQVEHGKPAPDLFLYAAENINTPPSNCLVLEDTPKGIEAAVRAGMSCYAIPSNETKGMDFQKATRVMESLSDVPKYLREDRFREFTLPPLPRS